MKKKKKGNETFPCGLNSYCENCGKNSSFERNIGRKTCEKNDGKVSSSQISRMSSNGRTYKHVQEIATKVFWIFSMSGNFMKATETEKKKEAVKAAFKTYLQARHTHSLSLERETEREFLFTFNHLRRLLDDRESRFCFIRRLTVAIAPQAIFFYLDSCRRRRLFSLPFLSSQRKTERKNAIDFFHLNSQSTKISSRNSVSCPIINIESIICTEKSRFKPRYSVSKVLFLKLRIFF